MNKPVRDPDLSIREKLVLVPLVALIVGLGFYPQPVLDTTKPLVHDVIRDTEEAGKKAQMTIPVEESLTIKGSTYE